MEQAGIGDIRLIILGVARRPTAYAASTGRAAAGFVLFGSGVFAEYLIILVTPVCNKLFRDNAIYIRSKRRIVSSIYNKKAGVMLIPMAFRTLLKFHTK